MEQIIHVVEDGFVIGKRVGVDRPSTLNVSDLEKRLYEAKHQGKSKMDVHLCHLQELIDVYREVEVFGKRKVLG